MSIFQIAKNVLLSDATRKHRSFHFFCRFSFCVDLHRVQVTLQKSRVHCLHQHDDSNGGCTYMNAIPCHAHKLLSIGEPYPAWHYFLTGSCSKVFGHPLNFQEHGSDSLQPGCLIWATPCEHPVHRYPHHDASFSASASARSSGGMHTQWERKKPNCFTSQAKPPVRYLWGPYRRYFPAGLGRFSLSIS